MRAHIGPRVREILGAERGIGPKEIGFARSVAARLLQEPYRDSSADNDGGAAAHARDVLDAGKRIPKIARDPLKELRLLTSAHLRQELLGVHEGIHAERLPRKEMGLPSQRASALGGADGAQGACAEHRPGVGIVTRCL